MNEKTAMENIVHFAEFLLQVVEDEEKRGNRNARVIIQNYLEVINDGLVGLEGDDLKYLKQAQRILK